MKKPKTPPKTSGTYSIRVECSNCDHQGTLELPKGHAADGKHKCPNCGCETAVKATPKPPMIPYVPKPDRIAPFVPRMPSLPYPEPWISPSPFTPKERKYWMQTEIRPNTGGLTIDAIPAGHLTFGN